MAYPNDNYANATLLTRAAGSITPIEYGDANGQATVETGESTNGDGETLWWKWVAPASGTVIFDTLGSPATSGDSRGLDTVITAFSGGGFAVGQQIDNNDDSDVSTTYRYNSRLPFSVVAGTTYWIQVDFYRADESGTLHLNWSLNGAVPGPPDPEVTSVTPASGVPGTAVVITGVDLTGVTAVKLGGVTCVFTVDSGTQISTTVPTGAPGGAQMITVTKDAYTSPGIAFTVTLPPGVLKVFDGTTWRKVGCASPGTASVVDDFTRPDAMTLGPDWIEAGGGSWGILNNAATMVSAPDITFGKAVRECNASDGTLRVTLSNPVAGGENAGVVWRYLDGGNYWWLDLRETSDSTYDSSHTGTFALRRNINGGETTIANATLTPWVAGDVVKVVMAGPSIEVYRNDILIVSTFSSVLQSETKHGLFGFYNGYGDVTSVLTNISTWDSFQFEHTATGRLRLQLPDGSWIQATCGDAPAGAHPLKIEDPANPGTWKTVACMVPVP